jgi:hypothetical protein
LGPVANGGSILKCVQVLRSGLAVHAACFNEWLSERRAQCRRRRDHQHDE